MIWFLAVVAVLVLGAIAVIAAGAGEPLQPVHPDRPDRWVPADRSLTSQDVRQVRFAVGVRGYRMDEVDALLDRLADELEARERHGENEADEQDARERHADQEPHAPAERDAPDRRLATESSAGSTAVSPTEAD